MAKLDARWKGWVKENLDRNCAPQELVDILLKNQFDLAAIRDAMGDRFPQTLPQVLTVDHRALCNIRITRPESGAKPLGDPRVQLFTFEHFMSDAECDELVAIIRTALRPSTVTIQSEDKSFRTSTTSDLSLLKHPFVEAIDEKIASTLGIRLPYSEGIQAQRYDVGQQFKPHTDFFEPFTSEYEKYAAKKGQRTWTFMVYLNDTPKGGGTQFTQLDKIFYPKKGTAVIWNNLLSDGDPNRYTEHCGMPVEEGEKIIITKWFRENGSGEMFY